ncbi:uncharacterized protein LOC106883219 isoform X2 [Octopus bimaculoides]|uniref:uncharacterized protein LOC106883219 isoform X2 n=1 Tax=Octopus bimaculoides TaxID=37653 RepID=UPI0022E3EA27|nr:uncharacterized protein LOC106883219 isoform X2 [Octopus bimaculoides]
MDVICLGHGFVILKNKNNPFFSLLELGIDPDADISMPNTQNPLQQTVDGIMEDSGESKATRSPNLDSSESDSVKTLSTIDVFEDYVDRVLDMDINSDSSELHSAKALSTLDEYEEYLDKVLDTENNSICSSQVCKKIKKIQR